uniref:Uncharacterized protein n=1 Tax=Lepeophtheirus salmonis TaxID=72036 RepID=A0A0K2VC08_LEPSM
MFKSLNIFIESSDILQAHLETIAIIKSPYCKGFS